MRKIFEMKKSNGLVQDRYNLNLNIPKTNQVTFGTNSLECLERSTI